MKKLLLGLSLIATLFISCADDAAAPKDAGLQAIPSTTSTVTAINIKQLFEKADFDAVKKMAFYKEMIAEVEKDGETAIANVLRDPASSGINLDANAYVMSDIDAKNPERIFTAIVMNLKDVDAFEKLATANAGSVEQQSGYKTVANASNPTVAWNDDIVVIGAMNNGRGDNAKHLDAIFNGTEEGSIAGNKDLQKALAGGHDISSWFNTNQIATNPQAGLAMSMLQIPADALKDNSIHGTYDFENGAIVGNSEFFMNKELGKNFIGRFFKDDVSTNFGDYLPAENLVFATSMALDFKGIDQFLSERPQAKGFVDYTLKEYGLTMKDVIETFGGDVLVAGLGGENIGSSNMFIATDVKDDAKLETFIDLAIENNMLQELDEDVYKIMTVGLGGFTISQGRGYGQMVLKDGMLFISADESLLEKLQGGKLSKADRADGKIIDVLDENVLGAYFDFEAVRDMSTELKNVQFDHIEFEVDGKGAKFKMDLENDNVNSLKAIFEMINDSYLDSQKREAM